MRLTEAVWQGNLEVSSSSEYDDGVPNEATVELSAQQVRAMLRYSQFLHKEKAYSVSVFDGSAEWAEHGGETPRVSAETLCVRERAVHWAAYMKYSGTEITTDEVSLLELAEYFKLPIPDYLTRAGV